ncbi:extracellular ribonuclease LE-like [Hibiscus syriacus]|uniref:extracellular ribonuclease LE-like n=1 Tax=Hibiscus syriacus TaxID=106335 RepID=UPI001924C00A|nr:extracellular ribonuclease LE-like [Hibiscus syriacus]
MACGTPISTVLTIHGIWPQDANDVPIPPNNASTNPCYSMAPITSVAVLQKTTFTPIESNLISLWLDLKNPTQPGTGFWKREWLNHGTCSDYYITSNLP